MRRQPDTVGQECEDARDLPSALDLIREVGKGTPLGITFAVPDEEMDTVFSFEK